MYGQDVSGERYRWVVLAAGTLAQASFSAFALGVPVLAVQLRSHYHLSLGETGVVLGATGMGMLPTLLPWGLLADRIGERLVIAVGLTGAAAAIAATAETTTFAALVPLLALGGALGASVNAASGRAVMGWFGAAERGLALGIRQTAMPIGAASAAVSLPWLASIGGTRLAFLCLAGGLLAGAGLGGGFLRDAPRRATVAPGHQLASPVRDPRMWQLAGGSGLYLVAQISIISFVVLFLHEHRGVSDHAAAGLLAGINVLGVGARIGAGRWSDRRGTRVRPLREIGMALTLATALVAALVDAPLPALLPALVVGGVLALSWNGLSFTAAAETAGPARSGAALGFQQMLLGVLVAAVPPVFAALVAASSWRVGYACAVAGPARRRLDPAPSAGSGYSSTLTSRSSVASAASATGSAATAPARARPGSTVGRHTGSPAGSTSTSRSTTTAVSPTSRSSTTRRRRQPSPSCGEPIAFFARYGIRVERVLTDNGSAYRSVVHAIACRRLGIRHLRTRPHRPQTNGKAERFIRTLLAGWAYGPIYGSSSERTAALDGWLWHYNHRRRHSALGHQPPVSRTNLLGSYS